MMSQSPGVAPSSCTSHAGVVYMMITGLAMAASVRVGVSNECTAFAWAGSSDVRRLGR